MEYVEITFKVPSGYEDQIKELVMNKIEAIISHIALAPSQAQKEDFDTKIVEAYDKNAVVGLPIKKEIIK